MDTNEIKKQLGVEGYFELEENARKWFNDKNDVLDRILINEIDFLTYPDSIIQYKYDRDHIAKLKDFLENTSTRKTKIGEIIEIFKDSLDTNGLIKVYNELIGLSNISASVFLKYFVEDVLKEATNDQIEEVIKNFPELTYIKEFMQHRLEYEKQIWEKCFRDLYFFKQKGVVKENDYKGFLTDQLFTKDALEEEYKERNLEFNRELYFKFLSIPQDKNRLTHMLIKSSREVFKEAEQKQIRERINIIKDKEFSDNEEKLEAEQAYISNYYKEELEKNKTKQKQLEQDNERIIEQNIKMREQFKAKDSRMSLEDIDNLKKILKNDKQKTEETPQRRDTTMDSEEEPKHDVLSYVITIILGLIIIGAIIAYFQYKDKQKEIEKYEMKKKIINNNKISITKNNNINRL